MSFKILSRMLCFLLFLLTLIPLPPAHANPQNCAGDLCGRGSASSNDVLGYDVNRDVLQQMLRNKFQSLGEQSVNPGALGAHIKFVGDMARQFDEVVIPRMEKAMKGQSAARQKMGFLSGIRAGMYNFTSMLDDFNRGSISAPLGGVLLKNASAGGIVGQLRGRAGELGGMKLEMAVPSHVRQQFLSDPQAPEVRGYSATLVHEGLHAAFYQHLSVIGTGHPQMDAARHMLTEVQSHTGEALISAINSGMGAGPSGMEQALVEAPDLNAFIRNVAVRMRAEHPLYRFESKYASGLQDPESSNTNLQEQLNIMADWAAMASNFYFAP